MVKIIIFLGLIAAIHCQPVAHFYEDSYYPEESAQDYEPAIPEISYYKQKRSIQDHVEFDNQRAFDHEQHPALVLYYYPEEVEEIEALERHRRSLQPGAPTFPMPNQEPPTKVTPHVVHQDGTTNVGAKVDHKFGNHDASAHWNKNVRGPGKAKPNWGVRGTFRF